MCYLPPFFYSWSPKGQLVAHIHDHMQSVNKYGTLFYSVNGLYLLCLLFLHRLCVLPDSTLFASFSDDCTVKLWDVQKMDGLHVINKPRLTYTLDGQLFILFFIYSFFSLIQVVLNQDVSACQIRALPQLQLMAPFCTQVKYHKH